MLFEILVEIRVVAREHDSSRAITGETRIHRGKLGGERMLATGEYRDAGDDLDRAAGDQLHTTSLVKRRQHRRILRIDRLIEHGATVVRVMLEFVPLEPDARLREQIGAVQVVPMDVRDDDVADVLWLHSQGGERV